MDSMVLAAYIMALLLFRWNEQACLPCSMAQFWERYAGLASTKFVARCSVEGRGCMRAFGRESLSEPAVEIAETRGIFIVPGLQVRKRTVRANRTRSGKPQLVLIMYWRYQNSPLD